MANQKSPRPLVIERTYPVPPELVWQALTDPIQMKKWYFDLPDFKAEVGHRFQFEGGPPEKTYLHLCEVKAAVPNQKLAYSWRYDGYPGDSLVTFELFAEGEKTRVKLTHSGLESFAAANNPDFAAKNFEMGWTDILGRSLMDFLQITPGLSFTRVLDAPRELVFKAWTQPERLAKWWGPTGMELKVLKFDLQPSGIFHYSMSAKNGFQMFGRFTFREITSPERLVFINSFADEEGNIIPAPIIENFPLEVHNVLTFTEQDGKTIMTLQGGPLRASETEIATYRGMKESMEKGFGGTFDQLVEYLKAL
ncbi:MAG: SRPBCC domain-containing protein [Saprospiraceae bacterium]|nr:SRPBCC domain-containing protein [Saprospiraceae bacterium]MCF8249540.1 SRPBCC domain-containing protein [Saprospiraceae bacterium]MCF8281290.1 SRPBCC domain-containing protein [Bacteroidales bacterium]MCF8310758.1 SRPBCC domain-containing protein [Saprospiraceae bacterium]MCF8439411.1 SRPBCC domain-containing protein [Saprospiraceae bacterium]